MYSTQVFYYTQRQVVVVLSNQSTRSYMPQYAKPLTLHRGVDNKIQFQFLNQEQRPVNITDKEILCRVIDATGEKVLITKQLDLELAVTGIAALTLNASDLASVDAQKCSYSLVIPVNTLTMPVFVDQNAGGRGTLHIVDSILPSFVPSVSVSIPSNQQFPASDATELSPPVTFYTSAIASTNPTTTYQLTYSGFTGTVNVKGSVVADSDWYTVESYQYSQLDATTGYTIVGYHPYVKFEFVTNCGSVSNVLAR